MIAVAIEHRTTYRFDRPISIGPHVVRLRPAPHSRTPIEAYSLTISPADHFINWQQDPFGNYLARVVFPSKASELEITVGLVADMAVINPFDFFIEEYAENYPFAYPPELRSDLQPYLDSPASALGPLLDDWLAALPAPADGGQPMIVFLSALNSAVNRDIAYSVRMEEGVQTPDETLARRIGSCRDSAWLLVTALRHFGLAARFVSGYLVQLAADQKSIDGPSGPEEDFTDLHAWAEVYVPGAGWIGLDPTSALFAGEGHIPLAATPNPSSSAAITGATEPSKTTMEFANIVRRVHEDPRVTKPYSEAQVEHLQRVGQTVDDRLNAAGIELTMGGEPTFVSVDDMTSAQWTVAADGPEKRELANRAGRSARRPVRPRRPGAARPGQVVSRRVDAALADRADLADRRRTAVDRSRTARRPARSRRTPTPTRSPRPKPSPGRSPPTSSCRPNSCRPASRTRWPRWPRRCGSRRDRGRTQTPRSPVQNWSPSWIRVSRSRSPGRCRCCRPGSPRAGRAPPGGPVAAGWSSSPATSRPACGCRSARSPGPTRSSPARRATTGRDRRWMSPVIGRAPSWSTPRRRRPGRRWWCRPETVSSTSSCRRWSSWRSSSS